MMKYIVYIFALVGFFWVLSSIYLAYEYSGELSDFPDDVSNIDLGSIKYEGFDDWKSNQFSDNIYFDYEVKDPYSRMPVPPRGNAELFGLISRNGTPVSGMSLSVVLNGQYKLEGLVTDDEGRFSFSVPAGNWTINVIMFDGWKGKPEGDFVLRSGHEQRLGTGNYRRSHEDGRNVYAALNKRSTRIAAIELMNALEVNNLSDEIHIDSPNDYVIEWEPHPEAFTYAVLISRVKERGRGASYYSLVESRVSDSSFRLSTLTIVKDEGNTNIYSIELTAFDSAGTFVSESTRWDKNRFKLVGYKIVGTDVTDFLGADVSESNIEKIFQNDKRADAAEYLIEDGFYNEAQNVINKIEESLSRGKKHALTGFLLAKRGQCAEAKAFLDKALEQGGVDCFPDRYYAACKYD